MNEALRRLLFRNRNYLINFKDIRQYEISKSRHFFKNRVGMTPKKT